MPFSSLWHPISNGKVYLTYVQAKRAKFNSVASTLGVSSSAIAASMMEEYRAQNNRGKNGVGAPYWFFDAPRDRNTLNFVKSQANPQAFLETLYAQNLTTIAAGKPVDRQDVFGLDSYAANPMGLDVGVGNIRFGFAILLLKNYIDQHPADDPLNLKQYQGNYVKLLDDMSQINSDVEISIAGLVIKDAYEYYINNPDPVIRDTFLYASQADKDRLIDIRYRSSKEMTAAIVKNKNLLSVSKRSGFPNFFFGENFLHENTYQFYKGILDGSYSVRGNFVFTGGNAVVRSPQWNGNSTQEIIVNAFDFGLQNGHGSIGLSSSYNGQAGSPETINISLYDNDHRITKNVAIVGVPDRYDAFGDYVDPVTVTHTASSVTVNIVTDTNTMVTIVASRADGSMTMTIKSQLVSLKPESQVRYTPSTGGVSASITVSDPNETVGQKFTIDASGNVSAPSTVNVDLAQGRINGVVSNISRAFNPDAPAVKVGDIIGSTLGNYLSGGNQLVGILYSSALGEIGQRIGGTLNGASQGLKNDAGTIVNSSVAASFTADVWSRMQGAAIGTASSMLSAELAKSLGLSGIGGLTFSAATSSIIGKVAANALDGTANNLLSGVFDPTAANPLAGAGSLMANALGSFFGAKLGALVVKPRTEAGVALSSIGSAVGVWAATGGIGAVTSFLTGTAATATSAATAGIFGAQTWIGLNFLAPGVGAFVGFVLGALIGNLFGKKKPKIPTASAETVLQIPYAQYQLGTITVTNNGNRELVTSMATTARDTLNGLIAMVAYTNTTAYVSNLNGYSTTQAYGHDKNLASGQNEIYATVNGVKKYFTSADQALEFGTLAAIRNTKIVGGDLLMKRAISRSGAPDLTVLNGDFTTASDYKYYRENRELINGYIVDAFPTSTDATRAAQIASDKAFYAGNAKTLIDKVLAIGRENLSASDLGVYNSNKAQYDRVIAMIGAQVIANPWIITLERVSELGLDKWTTSDFYGGLQGFLGSFDLAGHGTALENVRIMAQGGGAEIQARSQTSDGVFSILPQAIDGASDNDVLNARFQGGLQGWDLATWNVANPQRGVNLSADWAGSGNDSMWMYMPGTPAAGAVMDTRSDWMLTDAGYVYEASVKAAQHRGTVQLLLEFYDANRNLISTAYMSGSARESGGYHGDLANYNTISGTATAPAGTVYRRLNLRLVATGGEIPFGFYTQPTSRSAGGAALNWNVAGEAVRIEDLSQVGYGVRALGGQTSDNDLIDLRLSNVAVTIDDNHSETQTTYDYYWNGYDYEQVETTTVVTVDGGDDIFVGSQYGDTLYGRSGWDWLDGRAGNDWIEGGAGNDVLIGRNGDDALFGGDGDDYLAGGGGADGAYGGTGNDIIVDGDGSECLQGDDGDDTLLIAADYSFNWFWGGTQSYTSDPNGKDTISAERLTVGVSFNLDFRPPEWVGHPDPIAGDSRARAAIVVDAVTGAWLASEGLVGIENATGSNFNDRLYGTIGDNVLKGLAGDDQLYGQEGGDILEGGAGADQLFGGPGPDFASYESSSAGVFVDLSTGEAFGGDADGDTLSDIGNVRGSKFADQLKGNASAGRLEGLAGDDWLVATAGADVYLGGEGKDFVDYSEATAGIYLILSSYTPTFQYDGTGYSGLASGHTYNNVEGVVGSAYTDYLYGGEGDQTFIGGLGSDYLAGGAGADTYVLNRGDGYDTVTEDATGWNVVSFGENVKFSDLWGGTAGGASGWLDLGIRGTSDTVRVVANFGAYPTAGNNKLKSIDLNGAAQLDIGGMTYGVGGDDNANTLNGSAVNYDLIFAYNGADYITGSNGAWEDKGNVIIGGLGNDVIVTSGGDDQFAYDRGDGLDSINDAGGEDTLVFGPTVTAEDVIYQVVGDHLYIGARNPLDASQTAYYTPDHVQIWNGGIKSVVKDGYTGQVMYESLNTVEYVIAGGTSIDLRKLDIAWTEQVSYNYDYYYPIALDLDGDGLNMSAVDSSNVVVKTAGGGLSKIGWVGPTDGFLAVDRDGDGAINKLSEISFVQDKPGATSDLEGLRTWDTSGDGVLDAKDANFSKILLFVDANQNGRSTAKELRTLEQAGIKAINLGGTATGNTREMTTDSFVQNTISFVWADGRTGEGYDVALARRVLGSEGLYAGEYQAEWGARDEDGTLGRLANDPKTAAKAARIKAKKGLLDKLGASYAEVKAAAQLDFSDTDKVDAAIAQRWKKMDASQKAAWLSGQASGMDGQQNLAALKAISSGQALSNALAKGAQAGQDLVANGLTQAGALVSAGDPGDLDGGGQAMSNGLGVTFDTAASLGGLAASQPLDAALSASAAIGQGQAWWRGEPDGGLSGAGSLAALLATMDQGVGQPAPGSLAVGDDPALLQQQMLLRQAMAGFGGQAGGSAAVWNRDTAQASAMLAAAGQVKTPSAFNLALAS